MQSEHVGVNFVSVSQERSENCIGILDFLIPADISHDISSFTFFRAGQANECVSACCNFSMVSP